MRVITLDLEDRDRLESQLEEAADFLRDGKVVVYPTDTIYGIGCDALNEGAIKKVMKIKGYKEPRPFSVIVRDIESSRQFVFYKNANERMMAKILPGPFTVILPGARNISPIVTAGTGNLGVRIPDSLVTQIMTEKFENPIITTSVNETGREPMNDSFQIVEYFKSQKIVPDLILDGGRIINGKPSIILDLTGPNPQIKRSGAMTVTETMNLLKMLNE